MRRILTAMAVAASFLVLATAAVNAEPRLLRLDPEHGAYPLSPYLDILEDPEKRLTIGEVADPACSGRFREHTRDTLNLGFSRSAWWIRFTVSAEPDSGIRPRRWLLDIPWPYVTSLRFYTPRPGPENSPALRPWSVSEAGDPGYLSPGNRPGTIPVFRLPNDLSSPTTLYLRVESVSSLFLPLEVCTNDAYLNKSKLKMFWYGMYYGVIAALALYNLFLFASLRDRSYLWYVSYVVFLGLYFLGFNGLTREYLFPGRPESAARLIFLSLGLLLLGAGLFARSFLLTRRYAPSVDRMLVGYMATVLALTGLSPFLGFRMLNDAFSILGAVAPLVLIAAGISSWLRGFRPARFFLLAWSLYSLTGFLFALVFRGVLDLPAWGFHAFQAGSALESVLLSFALADRIKNIQREREEARRGERRYQELAFTDSLTGLSNTRHFRTRIVQEVQRAESQRLPLSLLLLDVDDFKRYNDTWGHPEGDRVLARLGRIILTHTRETDLGCRYGGEEFAVILRGISRTEAVEVAERIRSAFAAESFSTGGATPVSVTVSIGVAEHIPGQASPELVERADQALYTAKRQGKNRVEHGVRPPS